MTTGLLRERVADVVATNPHNVRGEAAIIIARVHLKCAQAEPCEHCKSRYAIVRLLETLAVTAERQKTTAKPSTTTITTKRYAP